MTPENTLTPSRAAMREQLRLLAIRQKVGTEWTVRQLREVADVLRHHPTLGGQWGDRMNELLNDCQEVITELYEKP